MYRRKIPPTTTTERNIQTMLRLENEFLEQRSWAECMADKIAEFIGTLGFIMLQLGGIFCWIILNENIIPNIKQFDPFPYPFLSGLLALEGVLLAGFVLIKQNRMSFRADHRSHLDLQVNLLAEQEATKILQMLVSLSNHVGLKDAAQDAEAHELAANTPLEDMARDLDRRLTERTIEPL